MVLIILLSLLAGIALAALYIFLVSKFTSSYDREISLIFFPIPFILGACIFYCWQIQFIKVTFYFADCYSIS